VVQRVVQIHVQNCLPASDRFAALLKGERQWWASVQRVFAIRLVFFNTGAMTAADADCIVITSLSLAPALRCGTMLGIARAAIKKTIESDQLHTQADRATERSPRAVGTRTHTGCNHPHETYASDKVLFSILRMRSYCLLALFGRPTQAPNLHSL
jgi:hypothetical protein